MMFSIDGIEWDIWCEISRVSEMTASEISGMLLNKQFFNDVLGTWLKYDVSIVVPYGKEDDYAELYEALTQPVSGHTFVFPYNNGTVQINGRIGQISDIYERMPSGQNYWRGIKFTVISNAPTKTMSLSEVLTVGASPFPTSASVTVGSIWQYTADGWVEYEA